MEINREQLKDIKFLESLRRDVSNMAIEDDFHQAHRLAKSLRQAINQQPGFDKGYPDLFHAYERIIARLNWIGLNIMSEKDVVKLFRNNFTEIFKIPDYELERKLRIVLLAILILEDRDDFKKKLRAALLDNREKLIAQKIVIQGKEEWPTVSNWIRDYNSTVGTGQIEEVESAQYFVKSRNFQSLNDEDKNKVKVALDLYKRLKLSSMTKEGLENEFSTDDEGQKGIWKNGIFFPYKEPKIIKILEENKKRLQAAGQEKPADLAALKNLLNQYPEGSLERKAVEEEIGKLESGSRN